jgi:hypothetical protein
MKRSLSILFSFMVVRAFLDGHNGAWAAVKLFDRITVKGLVWEDDDGPRLRVRN